MVVSALSLPLFALLVLDVKDFDFDDDGPPDSYLVNFTSESPASKTFFLAFLMKSQAC
jgi:hypothetical protein